MLPLTARTSRAHLLVCATLLMGAGLAVNLSAETGDEARRNEGIVGAWKIQFVSPTNPPQFQPIPGVMTFTSDRTIVESDGGEVAPTVIPGVPTQYGTTGQGVWKCGEDGEVVLKIIEIFVFPDATLSARGTLKFSIKLHDDGKSFSGTGSYQFVDPNGNVLATGTENLEGQRITIE
jgi:hypothetical protein